ncbi:M20 family metallopeptidase [Candidatus Laterigemmans baculatus]|uniref:M20 family metallopeptidase n=1 Tax=Candidatus Laterigemmans baculatus TaxID=2770505 RepID=UPI0013DA03D4|nr:M20 family metallopeptidase [Candidatus Laterigemmans baculatus]
MLETLTQEVLETLADLVRINSVNPNYEGGVPEAEMADYIESYFASRGIETWRQSVFPDRPNVIARVPGRDSQRRIVFEAHMDTVSVSGMTIPPWTPEIRDGRMYGRGACDTKGGMAAMMHALASLHADALTPPCDVWFAATIDEEYSYRGVVALCKELSADAAVIAEPTLLQPVVASKGLVRWQIESRGRSAHSAKPHLGVNAIEHMAHLIVALEQDTLRLSEQPHPLLGPATCNVGVVRGGVQINFVPDRCVIEIDRRMLPGETCESVLNHYQRLVDSVVAQHPGMEAVMHPPMLTDVPLETRPDSQAARQIARILEEMQLDPTLIGVPFCSDASKFGAIGIPSIIFGPGSIDQAHAAVEYIDCDQVQKAAAVYRRFMLEFN